MLIDFFIKLRDYKVPVSLNEFLIFLEALGKDFIEFDINKFIISPEQVLSKMKSYLTVLILFFQNIFSQSKKLKLMMFLNLLTSLKNGLKKSWKNILLKMK